MQGAVRMELHPRDMSTHIRKVTQDFKNTKDGEKLTLGKEIYTVFDSLVSRLDQKNREARFNNEALQAVLNYIMSSRDSAHWSVRFFFKGLQGQLFTGGRSQLHDNALQRQR